MAVSLHDPSCGLELASQLLKLVTSSGRLRLPVIGRGLRDILSWALKGFLDGIDTLRDGQ